MEQLTLLPVEQLQPSSVNVRLHVSEEAVRKLAEDIAARGLLHPLIVRPEGGAYGVVCGRMRLEAIKLLQRERPEVFSRLFGRGVPCQVRELDDREALELSLAENIRQNTLTPEEVGRGLARLYELGLPEEEIARRVLVEVDTIRRAVRLYSRLSAVMSLTAESKPGRPPLREQRRRISRSGLSSVARAVEQLQTQGEGGIKPDEVVRKVAEWGKGKLSTGELRLLAERLKRDASLLRDEERLKNLIEEISREGYVERVVLLKRSLIGKLEELAKREGLSFDEELNRVIEKALAAL
ncbi:MAG: ParB N-terminal domain-containing protein [Thermofilum sp.]